MTERNNLPGGTQSFEDERDSFSRFRSDVAEGVPEPFREAESDPGIVERTGGGPIGAALKQVCGAAFSEEEWNALFESHRVISNLESREEDIRIDYQGPPKNLAVGINELPVSEWSERFGVPLMYRVLLFSIVRKLRPRMCLELGTAAGYSALHIAQALALNGTGTLHTIEGDENSYKVGRETLQPVEDRVRAHQGFFDEVLDGLLPGIAPLDFVFIDGAHTGKDEVRYAGYLAEHLSPEAVVIYDDIRWSNEMSAAWEEIRHRPEVGVSLDFGKLGIIQTRKDGDSSTPYHFTTSVERGHSGRKQKRQDENQGAGIKAENIAWIFGASRTGSAWLMRMMAEMPNTSLWGDPKIGALFGAFYKNAHPHDLDSRSFVLGEPAREGWTPLIRDFVLGSVRHRKPRLGADSRLIVNEPNASVGASLIMEAFPGSRMILMVRDPRDVAASFLNKSGGAPKQSKASIEEKARAYRESIDEARRAYDAHEGPKTVVRYEDLAARTLETLEDVHDALGIPHQQDQLAEAVNKHSSMNVPDGRGKDLRRRQLARVEEITAPLLSEFYSR